MNQGLSQEFQSPYFIPIFWQFTRLKFPIQTIYALKNSLFDPFTRLFFPKMAPLRVKFSGPFPNEKVLA